MKILNPANGSLVAEVTTDTSDSVQVKFQAAKLAQPSWARVGWPQKKLALEKFCELLERDQDDLAKILSSETGKPFSQALNEVRGTLPRIRFFLEKTPDALREETVFDELGLREVIRHEPLGVVLNISAWNYPYFVGSNVFVPALLAGNAVLYKPSEFATLTGLAIAERLYSAGIPKDVFSVLVGEGEVGAAAMKCSINGLFFTGSYATGKKIAETVGPRLMKIQLELGGKDPTYVCEDANAASAAEGLADGAFYNAGQSCCSVERLYVHEKIYDAFVEKFVSTVKGFEIGDPLMKSTYIGPLTRSAQVAVLEAQVKDAVAKGARIIVGGRKLDRAGNYFSPTVLLGVDHTMDVMNEESFGPIIGIQKVASDSEAVRLMNDSRYGLTAGVYTPDQARAEKILSQINAGSVYWNCCDRVSPRLPWSGRGQSGVGTTLSKYGIQAFTQLKAWHLKNV